MSAGGSLPGRGAGVVAGNSSNWLAPAGMGANDAGRYAPAAGARFASTGLYASPLVLNNFVHETKGIHAVKHLFWISPPCPLNCPQKLDDQRPKPEGLNYRL